MNTRLQKLIAMFSLIVLLASLVLVPNEVSAANDFYGDYTDVAKVYDYGSCPSIQGLAVGSQKMYAVKINSSDSQAFITMADKDSGATVKLYNADANSYYFNYLDHANDMDVWGIDGYSHLFVATTKQGANGIVRLKRDGNNLNKVATYHLKCNGEDICATAMGITGVSDGKIHFITKWGMQLYTGSVDVNATNATINMTEFCSITKSRVYIKGEYLDLSNFVNQGMGYYDGTLFVPISGDDSQLNRSVIMVFDLNNATPGTTVYPTEALVFRVTSGAYSALFELESCDICSGDKKLYFGVQRRKTNSDTDHDGIASFDGYTYSRLPVDAPTSEPVTQTYTVRYNANGGTGSSMADTVVTYGVSTKLRTNTYTRNGWDFAGWHAYRTSDNKWYYTNGSSYGWYVEGSQPSGYYKDTYNDGTSVAKTSSVNKDLVIMYAQWTPKDITYTIRYNANGGTGTMDDTVVVYGYGTPLRENTFVRNGYKFVGWTAYRTAKSQWFYTNGTDSGWYAEGSQPTGYYKSIYNDGVSVAATTSVDGDVVIMYAQWEQTQPTGYTVTFKNADGTVLKSEVVTAGTVPTAPGNPTKAYDSSNHYTFKGWDKTLSAVTANTTYTATYTATAHSYTSRVTQAATCTTQGVRTYTCSCGYAYTEKIAATSHSYQTTVVAPTCTTGGYTLYTCSNCGDSYQGNITASTSHSYKSVVVDPTCLSNGYTNYTCSICGDSYQSNVIAATGHNYKATVIDPTCTTDGYTTYRCIYCGDNYQSDHTAATNHNYSEKVVAPTCTSGGYTTYTCQVCGSSYVDDYVDATGHKYTSRVVAPTCTAGGYTMFTCNGCGHSYKDRITDPTGHSYNAAVVKPTCTAGGYTTYTCTCGDNYTSDYTDPTGHSYKTAMVDATCTTDGTITNTCTGCGDTKTQLIPAKGHSFVNGNCTICGAADPSYETPVVQPTLTLKAPTLEFKDMITVNAFYTAENTQDVEEMGMITYAQKVTEVSVYTADYVIPGATYDAGSGRYFSRSQGIHAKYLADTVYLAIYAKLIDGSYVYTRLAPYSPITYANSQLKNSSDTKLKQLVVAMLNYGTEAQVYFGHNTDQLANAALTSDQAALPEIYRADMVQAVPSVSAAKQGVFASNSGFSARKPAISFEGAFCINYFFTPSNSTSAMKLYYWTQEDYNAVTKLTTGNATGTIKMTKEDGVFTAAIDQIPAKELNSGIYVAARYSSGGVIYCTGVLPYSIGTYCTSMATKEGNVAALAQATAVYGYYAKAYFG